MIGKSVPKLVESFPGVLRDTVPRLAVINDRKIEGATNEGVRVSKAYPLPKRTEVLSVCIIW